MNCCYALSDLCKEICGDGLYHIFTSGYNFSILCGENRAFRQRLSDSSPPTLLTGRGQHARGGRPHLVALDPRPGLAHFLEEKGPASKKMADFSVFVRRGGWFSLIFFEEKEPASKI